jgi:hypothetical protein
MGLYIHSPIYLHSIVLSKETTLPFYIYQTYCNMTPTSMNLGIRKMLQRHPLLSNVKHQTVTAIYMHMTNPELSHMRKTVKLLGRGFLTRPQQSDIQRTHKLTGCETEKYGHESHRTQNEECVRC